MTRMDLVIPGEQHMYLRAATSQERQLWLVALGSAKACVHKNRKETTDSNPDQLKTKKSELRLYCDLLMQQVHTLKTAISNEDGPVVEVKNYHKLFTYLHKFILCRKWMKQLVY